MWRPIQTHPKDGGRLFLVRNGEQFTHPFEREVGYASWELSGHEGVEGFLRHFLDGEPTEWAPDPGDV